MTRRDWAWAVALIFLIIFHVSSSAAERKAATAAGIPPEAVADYIHDVIEADRTFYTTYVVERMEMRGTVVASENWAQRGTLPLPAQFLKEAARLVREKRSPIHYRLISLWPINRKNGPENEFERLGLEEVRRNPDRPYTGTVDTETGLTFRAVYPDKAVAHACVGCHNSHRDSPKRDFKQNDIMGGIVISIPVEK
jgi:hypothetical protein